MYSLIVIGSLLLFVVSEKSFLHFSRTARRAFWYVLSCAIVLWVVKWLQELDGIGMIWIFITAVLAASVVEDEYLKKTGLTPMDIEGTQTLRAKYRTPEAQGHAERIMDIVNSINRGKGYTAGTKQLVSHVSGATKRLQKALHRILSTAGKNELNYVLCAVNVAAMVEVASDKSIKLLVGPRLILLETVSRAALVDGIQKLGMRHRRQRQEWARDVIIQTYGIELTHFKAYIDDGGDYHSMYKLLYNDLQGDIQDEVFEHIKQQGSAVLSAFESLKLSENKPPGVVLKILSDVDDTVFSSGGSFPAGVDARYPRKCYYPGALALYAAMDRHFAARVLPYIEALKSMTKTSQIGLDNSIKESERSSGLSTSLRRRTNPVTIPPLNISTTPRQKFEQAACGPVSPFSGQSPDFFMLGDLMTPRDSFGCPRDEIMQRSLLTSRKPKQLHQEGSNLVLLSARPESYKGLTESESYRKYFQPLVMRGDLDTSPTMLLGSLDSGPRALVKLLFGISNVPDHPKSKTATAALYQTLAAKKLSRFKEYAALYPEAVFIYVGDNGQGDVLCIETLTTPENEIKAPKSSQLIATFIHKVAPITSTLSMFNKEGTSEEELYKEWNQRRICISRTHLGMAKAALDFGLIDKSDMECIVSTALLDFKRIASRYTGRHAGRHLTKAANDLNVDIQAINVHSDTKITAVTVDDGNSDIDDKYPVSCSPQPSFSMEFNAMQ